MHVHARQNYAHKQIYTYTYTLVQSALKIRSSVYFIINIVLYNNGQKRKLDITFEFDCTD